MWNHCHVTWCLRFWLLRFGSRRHSLKDGVGLVATHCTPVDITMRVIRKNSRAPQVAPSQIFMILVLL